MQLHFSDRDSWRAWLKKHHGIKREVWLIFYKKRTGRNSIPYEQAVEEALCFGWIDSIIKKLDDERYLRKFTPRANSAKWSAINLQRAERLIKAGRMTKAGLKKIAPGTKAETPPAKRLIRIPHALEQALARNRRARENFDRLAPSYRRQYIAWVATAKRSTTLEKRVREAIRLLERNEKLGLR
jgi:uncharacterized protein YdeI (YjbR/CyaY-like superfamily)